MAKKNTMVKVMEKGMGMTEELRMAVAEI